MHWHLDYLREEATKVVGIPIRTQFEIEHDLAEDLDRISDWSISQFGSTDCQCDSHLFGFKEDPRGSLSYINFLLKWRIERYQEIVDKF